MKLSVIMPCFNVAGTIIRALDSIIRQKVNFEYEILVVDDASADNTVELVRSYAKIYPQVRVVQNETNKGNAYSYYTGLCAAQGEYFCVLDGDDYYTVIDKLQRQVDFLDKDQKEEYVGVATQYIIDLGDNCVSIPDRSTIQEFTYTDFLTQQCGYYHTATYMYRNIFKGNVPTEFGDALYRGDTPRTMFHLKYSGKKIKVLDFVGSAYTFEFGGIWSGLKQTQQFEYQINYQRKHKENVTTNFERQAADKLIKFNKEKLQNAQDDLRRYPSISIDEALHHIGDYARKFAFEQKDFVLQHVYYSSYIDSLCVSLGYIDLIHNPDHVQLKANDKNICIINGVLNPHGGGIFAEIDELIAIYRSKHVFLMVTEMTTVPESAIKILSKHRNLTIICPPIETEHRLAWFRKEMVRISPYRTYCYCSHGDSYGVALLQDGVCENITFFSFDHGYLCGISNSNLNCIIAKRPVDYWMLKKQFDNKVIYIPTWNDGAVGCEKLTYKPFVGHKKLITASGAARFYKVDGRSPYRYIDIIASLLKHTGGIHYHFGELPDFALEEIKHKLELLCVKPEQFIHIPWSDNIPLDLLSNHVDIFIEPFPIVSYKLTLEVLSIGMPIIIHQGLTRMSIVDFVPSDTLSWYDERDFINKLLNVDEEFLIQASEKARQYFELYHSTEQISKHIINNSELPVGKRISYPDDNLMDIMFSLRLFGNNYRVSIMNTPNYLNEKRNNEKILNERKKREKEEQYIRDVRNNILKIRSSKSFRLGFLCTFPIRILKQGCMQMVHYGPSQGIKRLRSKELLFYYRDDCRDELYTLQNSIAFKVGNMLARPYWYLKFGTKGSKIEKLNIQIESQQKQLNEITKLIQVQTQEQVNAKKTIIDSVNGLNGIKDSFEKNLRTYQQSEEYELLNLRKERLEINDNLLTTENLLDKFYKCQNDYDGTYAKILNEFSQTRDLLNQDGNRILSEVRRGNLIQKESLWGQIYNNTVQGSQWFRDNAVSPGRWAVGYPFLYVLYNVLEHMKPSNILEMGLGQSTKMITQYASTYPGIRHTVVEQNAEWVNFFCQNCYVAPNTSVEVLECGMENFRDAGLVRVYKGFEKLTMNKAYDFICIDGPSAEGMEFYSRIDVLKLLEKGLKDQFVIILDDCNRKGERCTAEMISSLLTEYNIDFSQGKYQGEKMFYIWTTKKYSFLCTL